MNIFNLLEQIQKVDGDVYDRVEHATRRHFLNRVSSKIAAVGAPALFASIVTKTYAQSSDAVDVVKYALTLEYLEDEFYKAGNAVKDTLMSGSFAKYQAAFAQIGKHETAHVKYLEAALTAGGVSFTKPNFDFTAGGTLDPFTNFDTFVFLSHAFEDTGVRAYKGQAGRLMQMQDKPYLQVALQIHSVEARHAAVSRKILSEIRNKPGIKSWITNSEGSPEAVYKADDIVTQGGVNLIDFGGKNGLPTGDALFKAASEAFDEILTMDEVYGIAGPFIKK